MKYKGIELSPSGTKKTVKSVNRVDKLLEVFDGEESVTRTELVDWSSKYTWSDHFTVGELKILLALKGVTVVDDTWSSDYKQQGTTYI